MRRTAAVVLALAAALSSCGGGRPTGSDQAVVPLSAGQVASPTAAPKVTHYAASRFAEQASFGPTPALVAEIRAKGFEKWIDEQFALPFVPIDVKPAEASFAYKFNDPLPAEIGGYFESEVVRLSLGGVNQLRLRVMWSLSQYIATSIGSNQPAGHVVWGNLLYRQAFGQYGSLLRDVTLDRHMGEYLNNDQNRPKSAECPHCAPNENYARELMQLFSLGVFKLNPDGTPQRDKRGRFIETYTQTDVEELARALTGWVTDPNPGNRPDRNWGNWGKPMVPSTWSPERDDGRKQVMGRVFPAGQGHYKDLDSVVAMLMEHPNIAPFVATRLIQHLVKSDPSPSYVQRVAAKFINNGSGVAGDMKAVIRAVLLDSEARRGDDPSEVRPEDGKFREPWLHRMAMFRGLGCAKVIWRSPSNYWTLSTQPAFRPDSVFSFYAPTDRAPGSNLLAPEQRLVDARELTSRLNEANALRWNAVTQLNDMAPMRAAGCNVDEFVDAYGRSSKDFLDLLSERYFRGAMPPTLRSTMEQIIRSPSWNRSDLGEGAMRMIGYALSTPYYGVIK